MKEIFVAPSILSADFCEMGKAVAAIEDSGAQWVHCDVMDGLFVPNITFGPKMVSDIRKITKLTLDAHLMIVNPERYVERFAAAGADFITVHIEAGDRIREALEKIKACGKKAGLSVKPNTPVSEIAPFLDVLDIVLIMSVEPGFSGQKFIPHALEKIREAKQLIGDRNILVQIDGGVNAQNAAEVLAAGADSIVAGNAFFLAADKKAAVRVLKGMNN